MINVEQFAATNKANLDNLFGLSTKAFAGVEKMVELNLTAGRAALNESAAHAQAVLAVKDAQELIALQTSFVQPLAEKSAAYSRHIYDIAQNTGAELTKGFEGKAAEGQPAQGLEADRGAVDALCLAHHQHECRETEGPARPPGDPVCL